MPVATYGSARTLQTGVLGTLWAAAESRGAEECVPYMIPLLPELARVNVMIVGRHVDDIQVSATCRMPARAFRLAPATLS